MSLTINTNLASSSAQRSQARTQSDLSTSIARLSSGLRINSAKDDAAGLAIADRFTAQIRGTTQAGRNANDGISLAQTAEGGLASIADNLQRIRELAVQSANATNSAGDRAALQLEVSQLQSEIDRVASQAQFNGINLLDGSFTAKSFQVGANVGQTISMPALSDAHLQVATTSGGFSNASTGFLANMFSGNLTITVGGTGYAFGTLPNDAKVVAAVVNASGISGLTATAGVTNAPPATQGIYGTAAGTAQYNINGTLINMAGSIAATRLADNRASAAAAINAQSGITGVTATDTGTGVSLSAADGRNIQVAYSPGTYTSSAAADFGLNTIFPNFWGASLSASYVAPTGITGNVVFAMPGFGGANATIPIVTTTSISVPDVSTLAGANSAIALIDSALAAVASSRALLGATQSRLDSAISNLRIGNENLVASRSRIQDADYAQETANLSRAQVLQQAGTAMIAQANQQPSQVLSLLR